MTAISMASDAIRGLPWLHRPSIPAAEATEEPRVSFRVTSIHLAVQRDHLVSGASAMCTHFARTPRAG
jgi:hypothetical protein